MTNKTQTIINIGAEAPRTEEQIQNDLEYMAECLYFGLITMRQSTDPNVAKVADVLHNLPHLIVNRLPIWERTKAALDATVGPIAQHIVESKAELGPMPPMESLAG